MDGVFAAGESVLAGVEELSGGPDEKIGMDGAVAGFRDEAFGGFRDGFHLDSGADGELVVGDYRFEVAGVAGTIGVLGAEEIGGRGLGIDGVEIDEAEGIGVE